jgi:hypothetical protein
MLRSLTSLNDPKSVLNFSDLITQNLAIFHLIFRCFLKKWAGRTLASAYKNRRTSSFHFAGDLCRSKAAVALGVTRYTIYN